jgi:hypothetical protein
MRTLIILFLMAGPALAMSDEEHLERLRDTRPTEEMARQYVECMLSKECQQSLARRMWRQYVGSGRVPRSFLDYPDCDKLPRCRQLTTEHFRRHPERQEEIKRVMNSALPPSD